jgi:PAS domain S-box-containing protein
MERDKNDLGNGGAGGNDRLRHANRTPGQDDRWLRSVVENISEIVIVVDPDGTLRYANPAWKRAFGHDPDEAVGTMNVLDHVHPEDLPRVLEEIERALAEGGITANEAEFRFRRKDGSWRWMESVGTYLLGDTAGSGVVVTSRDVTERKEAEEAAQQRGAAQEPRRRGFRGHPHKRPRRDPRGQPRPHRHVRVLARGGGRQVDA